MTNKELELINQQNAELASTIVKATITDWTGRVLFESNDYYEALGAFESFTEDDDVQLNSYDTKGINHGIFY